MFTKFSELQKLEIGYIYIDGSSDEFQLFANVIRNKKLKSILLRGSPITNTNSFEIICEALPDSAIESLKLESLAVFHQPDLNPLIKVLPNVNSLKKLHLHGQRTLNSTNLINILEYTQIDFLGLRSVGLSDKNAVLLAGKILATKLKRLDLRYNPVGLKGEYCLRAARQLKPEFSFWI